MSRLFITTWKWGTKYGQNYVDRLAAGVARNHRGQFVWRVFGPEPEDRHLANIPGCLCRLRMFDPNWQRRQGMDRHDRIVCLDLDAVVTGPLDPLFDRPEHFVILQGVNAINPCPFNGSVMMLEVGHHADVWTDFSFEAAQQVPWYAFPDDQSWLHHKLPDAGVWHGGRLSGIYGFKKKGWPLGDGLPADARLVVFPGFRDPSQFVHLPWVQELWLNAKPSALRHQSTAS